MAKLDKKDYFILDFINKQTEINGFPPSVREIGAAVGLTSTASVYNRLKKLENSGLLIKSNSKNRALKVINNENDESKINSVRIPILGNVAAGIPITAIQNNEDCFSLPSEFVRSRELFMLKVKGDSMINAAILDGDLIIVNHQQSANNGDIVVALVNNCEEATVKTFYKENGYIRLQPENDTMEPIIVNECSILGKVVGVFREL